MYRWYSEKFVKGEWKKEECVSEWQKYRACLAVPTYLPSFSLFFLLIIPSILSLFLKHDYYCSHQEHLDDKHLSRFLEADTLVNVDPNNESSNGPPHS